MKASALPCDDATPSRQRDVPTAYLNGWLDRDVHVREFLRRTRVLRAVDEDRSVKCGNWIGKTRPRAPAQTGLAGEQRRHRSTAPVHRVSGAGRQRRENKALASAKDERKAHG